MFEFETMDEAKLLNDTMWFLEKLFKKPLPRPINVKRTKWLTNENFLGSYSYQAMTYQDDTVENLARAINSPSGKPAVLFGGEATDKFYMGYVNGGMNSGNRAAQEIIDFYALRKAPEAPPKK
jgi:spermine oxidase